MEALVSCVITTYKRPSEMVRRAVESIIAQTYQNKEIIVVDDSPSDYDGRDDVKDMLESLEENIKYIRHEKNMGGCAARNTGIKNASGEFIAFLDDDDEWLPEKIELQMKKFKNENVALVYCLPYRYDQVNNKRFVIHDKHYRGRVYKKLFLSGNFIGSTSFVVVRKSVFSDVGMFDERMKSSQDYECWLRIAQKYSVDYVDKRLVNYYVHGGEQITKNLDNKTDAYEIIMGNYSEFLDRHKKLHSMILMHLVPVWLQKDRKKAIQVFRQAIKLYPFFTCKGIKAFGRIVKNYIKSARG